ncbi:TPA: hypothetical protein ACNVA0_004056 [Citrobacter freundii]|nr:hypothetical protein [Citrobacter freundii]
MKKNRKIYGSIDRYKNNISNDNPSHMDEMLSIQRCAVNPDK